MRLICALLLVVLSLAILVTEASAQNNPANDTRINVPSVSSTDQKNGVTAGYVHQLTQTILPTLVRGPQLERLKSIFVEGAKVKRSFITVTDDASIDVLCKSYVDWVNSTYAWFGTHISEYAAERFAFVISSPSLSYTLPGEHAAGYADKWGSCHDQLSKYMANLDQLMRDPSIYPVTD